ncbi:MAG: alpha/beta hydrolase [Candidatus Symbiodolus clandestinus]
MFQEREIFGIRITLLCKGRSHLQSPILKSCHLRIHGQRDPVILASDLEELCQLGNVKIVKLETAGHFIPLLAAQYFNALLLDFLSMEHGSL